MHPSLPEGLAAFPGSRCFGVSRSSTRVLLPPHKLNASAEPAGADGIGKASGWWCHGRQYNTCAWLSPGRQRFCQLHVLFTPCDSRTGQLCRAVRFPHHMKHQIVAPQPEVHEHRLNTWDPKAPDSNSQLEGNQRAPSPLPTQPPPPCPTHTLSQKAHTCTGTARMCAQAHPTTLPCLTLRQSGMSHMQRHTAPTQAQGRATPGSGGPLITGHSQRKACLAVSGHTVTQTDLMCCTGSSRSRSLKHVPLWHTRQTRQAPRCAGIESQAGLLTGCAVRSLTRAQPHLFV